jgi:hypothetical protein
MVLERALCISILDVEYQFDHHKLTVFFEADQRIDLRDLVSELFSLYKTRIWMQQVEVDTPRSPAVRYPRITRIFPATFSELYCSPPISPSVDAALEQDDDLPVSKDSIPHKSHISSPDVRITRTFPAIFSELYCRVLEQNDDLPVCPECGRVEPETW